MVDDIIWSPVAQRRKVFESGVSFFKEPSLAHSLLLHYSICVCNNNNTRLQNWMS